MRTLILQSCPGKIPGWLQTCLDSTAAWARRWDYEYRLLGDELFAQVPGWYMEKIGGRLPIAADLGRLQWARRLLDQDQADWVVWLDADVLVFAPNRWQLSPVPDCSLGYELWLQAVENKQGHTIHKNVHNAFCTFRRGGSTLPFLIDTTLGLMERVDGQHISPQFVGPKLLTSLHNIVGFNLEAHAGAISPLLAEVLLQQKDLNQPDGMLAKYCRKLPANVYAANLCASLQPSPAHMEQLINTLLQCPQGLLSLEVHGQGE